MDEVSGLEKILSLYGEPSDRVRAGDIYTLPTLAEVTTNGFPAFVVCNYATAFLSRSHMIKIAWDSSELPAISTEESGSYRRHLISINDFSLFNVGHSHRIRRAMSVDPYGLW